MLFDRSGFGGYVGHPLPDLEPIRPVTEPAKATRTDSPVKRYGPLLLIAAAIAVFFVLDLGRFISFDALSDNRDALKGFVAENHIAAVALYLLIYAVAVGLSLPGGTILTVTGGFLFGSIFGTIWTVMAATVGATAIFMAARSALGDSLRARTGNAIQKLEKGFQENAFNYMLFLRLVPAFPFFVVNIVPAFLNVPLRTYVITTFIGIIPGTFVFAQVGAGLDSVFAAGGTLDLNSVLTTEIILALVGLAVLALLPIAIKLLRRKPKN